MKGDFFFFVGQQSLGAGSGDGRDYMADDVVGGGDGCTAGVEECGVGAGVFS